MAKKQLPTKLPKGVVHALRIQNNHGSVPVSERKPPPVSHQDTNTHINMGVAGFPQHIGP